MATTGSFNPHLDIHFFNRRRHIEAEWKSILFIKQHEFMFRESGFRLSKHVCQCGRMFPHKKICIGTNGTTVEMCPYLFLIRAARLSALSGGEKIVIDGDGARRLIERVSL